MLLPINDKDPDCIGKIFERIRNSINTDLSVEDNKGMNVPFSVSMGFEVLNKGDITTAAELLNKADQKMYQDKNSK